MSDERNRCPRCGWVHGSDRPCHPKAPTPTGSSALFDKCVIRTCRGRSIRCCLGLWSVSAPDRATAEREARHYWLQYFTDGEYEKHLSSAAPLDPAATTVWIPFNDSPTQTAHYLVWVRDGGAGWADQACIEFYNATKQQWNGESGIIEDGGEVTHWAKILPPNGLSVQPARRKSPCFSSQSPEDRGQKSEDRG